MVSKKYKWLDPNNSIQLVWAWEFMARSNQDLRPHSPLNSKEYYDCVIAVFEGWVGHPAEAELFHLQIKRAWGQQKYRSSLEGEKQCTFVLKNDVREKLEVLAESEGIHIRKVLERLITNAYTASRHSKTGSLN